jgi:hypothetical protein
MRALRNHTAGIRRGWKRGARGWFESRKGTQVYDSSACAKDASVISLSRGSHDTGRELPSSRGKAIMHEGFRATVIDGRL